jgi:hypothetical protein
MAVLHGAKRRDKDPSWPSEERRLSAEQSRKQQATGFVFPGRPNRARCCVDSASGWLIQRQESWSLSLSVSRWPGVAAAAALPQRRRLGKKEKSSQKKNSGGAREEKYGKGFSESQYSGARAGGNAPSRWIMVSRYRCTLPQPASKDGRRAHPCSGAAARDPGRILRPR